MSHLSLRDETGQTLPELMIATVIGLIVVFAAVLALQTSITQGSAIAQREDASQRGRIALEIMSRELRAQTCVPQSFSGGSTILPPIVSGTGTSITFYSDLTGGKLGPVKRTLAYVAGTGTGSPPGKIVETDYQGAGLPPGTTFPTLPTKTLLIADRVVPISTSIPVFQYFQFAVSGTPGLDPTPLATPLSAIDAAQAVDVKVSFLSRGTASSTGANGNPNLYGSSFQDDVFTRAADPASPRKGVNC
jgi:hypothetical protein